MIEITMPKMGESIMEGTILKWHKQPGDKVERDETILEISTDKVDTEVPSPETGVITELLYKEGDVVEVGLVIANMSTDVNAKPSSNGSSDKKESKEQVSKEEAPKEEAPAEESPKEESPKMESSTDAKVDKKLEEASGSHSNGSAGSGKFYSPLVMNIAGKEGIGFAELEKISGTGNEGRVTKKDILNYLQNRSSKPEVKEETKTESKQAASQPAPARSSEKKPELPKVKIDYNEEGLSVSEFDNIRQKMAEHMVASVRISPHVTATIQVDLSEVDKVRAEQNKTFIDKEGFKLSYMPFICEAVVKSLKDYPLINSIIDDSSTPYKAITRNMINLGIAVAMDNGGLIVPVIKNADGKNLIGIARDLNDLAKRARVKKLTLDEIQGGTFSITNYGVFGNDTGTPIINQPQIAILGIGSIKKRAVVLETEQGDFIVPRRTVNLTLSFDHRLIDGALGGQFVAKVKEYLESYTV
ncbi:hypothetical protein BH10BAC5_BH10BAC5_20720 [soil metagenome]